MGMFISPRVRAKLLEKHNVTEAHVLQCFANRNGPDLLDRRPQHQTNPPTRWFIAETDYGIRLKVCYVYDKATKMVEIKSAFPPNDKEIEIYNKFGLNRA
jgi:hypothetical protein